MTGPFATVARGVSGRTAAYVERLDALAVEALRAGRPVTETVLSAAECWACGCQGITRDGCPRCGAPLWLSGPSGGGVYVVRAPCGLVKVGVSSDVETRVKALQASAPGLRVLGVMWAAERSIERWLHQALARERDPETARAERLPAHTEWFWPTPSLRRLLRNADWQAGLA